mgnify:CR=1 FL=1
MILDVPYIDQNVKYPTGCESVSTVMLLQYLGYKISVDEFIENYLEQDTFEQRRGEQYGPDPRKMFCGSPYDEESFGCYSPVIVKALNRFFERIIPEAISREICLSQYRNVAFMPRGTGSTKQRSGHFHRWRGKWLF